MTLLIALALSAFAGNDAMTGTWVLDKDASESVEPILKAQGLGMIQRKAAAGMAVTWVITVQGDNVLLEVQSTHKDDTQTLVVDGTARKEDGDLGESMVSHTWAGDALTTTSESEGKDGTIKTVMTRTLAEDGQAILQRIEMVEADGTTHTANRIFRKQ